MERVSQRHGKNYYRVIPVFKEDGVTEIDQFWIYNGTGKYGPGSKGDTAIVLDLTGMTKNDAVAALKEVGLVLGNITYVISDNEKGVVENQDPPAGTNLGSGSSIDITIKYRKEELDMAAKSGKITEEIINAEYQAVYHYILSLCRDEKEAEDITQDTFVKAISTENFRGREQLLLVAMLYRQKYMDR